MKTRPGESICAKRRSPNEVAKLQHFINHRAKAKDLTEWRRARCILGYIQQQTVISLAAAYGVQRGSINRWIQKYDKQGLPGLMTKKSPGRPSRLTAEHRLQITHLIDAGPIAAGYQSGVWTGPMIADLIEERFGVRYHNHSVPELLHELGFSLQRPRKRLARADLAKQATWLRRTFPAIKKKRERAAGE